MVAVKFRVARPCDDLAALRRFYVDGLGLLVRGAFEGHLGYDGLVLGTSDLGMEIEFTRHEAGSPCRAPSRDNLLVFYLDGPPVVAAVEARMAALGYPPVAPENPYWVGQSVTYEDPDGWRVVLFDHRQLKPE